MPAKRKSVTLSETSNAPDKRAAKRSRVGRDIISGLQEAAAFLRGEISLPVRTIYVPERVEARVQPRDAGAQLTRRSEKP